MESPSSQHPQQAPQQPQSSSTKNIKIWFDEFKARVSKKSQANLSNDTQSDELSRVFKDASSVVTTKTKASGLKARKTIKISAADSPDFDTASISTIFNRRDSRYDSLAKKRQKSILSKFLSLISWLVNYLIPFNYNLPWKLLSLINSTFVIIVIGLTSGSSQGTLAFSFFNGFICGLLVALICVVILTLSFIARILPKSPVGEQTLEQERNLTVRNQNEEIAKSATLTSFSDSKLSKSEASIDSQQKLDDFSFFEILDEESRSPTSGSGSAARGTECILDDDNYKGWMIEFIGDYELRNTSDIKLKLMFVKIEDGVLHLCKPKSSHDADSTTLPVFANQRSYDLKNMSKFSASLLLPKSVRNKQKYIWSKKYPIKLEFQEENSDATKTDNSKVSQLTLFAKSCREKEEWFRRFKRIFEEHRLSNIKANKRSSLKSEESVGNDSVNDSFFSSLRRLRRRSPSPKRDCVQTSQSSHLLNDPKKNIDDDDKSSESECSNLVRTKSCELLHAEQTTSSGSSNLQDRLNDDIAGSETGAADDSTLTRETAELFSQAMEYSNLIESQPTLNYKEYIERVIESGQEATSTSDWFNALTGRIFFDVFSHNYWSVWFKRKIQRKLYRIRLPYFMETLTLTKIDLGTNPPQFFNVVSHSFDSLGLSIDFDMAYSGGLTMTFETKLNLLKIKTDGSTATGSSNSTNPNAASSNSNTNSNILPSQSVEASTKDNNATSDSSLESFSKDSNKPSLSSSNSIRTSGDSSDSDDNESDSSSDSSIDEADMNEISDWEDYGAEKTRQNIVRFVDKIASSRYFQHATENRYIKKKLQDISNCPLMLIVQIQSLNGILTLNVPPPQTDRIWYGFKPMPELTLKALPKMGDREVNLSHVTDWIERKLAEEFRKILVIPNMEDIVLPVLKSDHLMYVTSTK